jgi:hypothetical protein
MLLIYIEKGDQRNSLSGKQLPGIVATLFQRPAQIGGTLPTPLAGVSRAIPRVRLEVNRVPVTTRGLRSPDGRKAITRRP